MSGIKRQRDVIEVSAEGGWNVDADGGRADDGLEGSDRGAGERQGAGGDAAISNALRASCVAKAGGDGFEALAFAGHVNHAGAVGVAGGPDDPGGGGGEGVIEAHDDPTARRGGAGAKCGV